MLFFGGAFRFITWRSSSLLAALLVLAGCNGMLGMDLVRSSLTPVDDAKMQKVVMLDANQAITLDTGYERSLARGSRWKLAGTIAEGQVYQPIGSDFTIQGREPVSAYLVVMNGQLVGFFLPVDESFSPLLKKVSVSFVPAPKPAS